MPKKRIPPSRPPPDLRASAEAAMRVSRADVTPMSAGKIQRLVHELQVHQIELEMQNEELRRSQVALSQSLDRFSEFYDFAPVGT